MKSFRYEFTGKELYYFLFANKKCPKCGNKMKKEKGFELLDGSIFSTNSVPLYIQGREVKYYHYLFNCSKCGTQFTLKNLANKNVK